MDDPNRKQDPQAGAAGEPQSSDPHGAGHETGHETGHGAQTPGDTPPKSGRRAFVEEVEVAGENLVARIKQLLQESNARRVVIRNEEGKELMTLPLTFGVVAGGLLAWASPLLAAVGALAALVTKVKLEVTREEDPEA